MSFYDNLVSLLTPKNLEKLARNSELFKYQDEIDLSLMQECSPGNVYLASGNICTNAGSSKLYKDIEKTDFKRYMIAGR